MLFLVKLFLKLSIRKSPSSLELTLVFVYCEEKDYRVVSVGQLSFNCCSYCRHTQPLFASFFFLRGHSYEPWNVIGPNLHGHVMCARFVCGKGQQL